MRPTVIAITALCAAGAAVLWMKDEPTSVASPSYNSITVGPNSSTHVAGEQPTKQVPTLEKKPWDAKHEAAVTQKYRYLLGDLRSQSSAAEILRLLFEYEYVAQQLKNNESTSNSDHRKILGQLANIDAHLKKLMHVSEYEYLVSLRDSDQEQQQLADYGGGISNFAPLSDTQQRAILDARLRHKNIYESRIRDVGMDRAQLSKEEREYVHNSVIEALREYREEFLQELRATLNDEQFQLLSDFEATEFKNELERLQIAINAK